MIDKELTKMAWDFSAVCTPDPFDRRTYQSPHAITPFVELFSSTKPTGSRRRPWSSCATTTTAAGSA
jgi:hypothetical protein